MAEPRMAELIAQSWPLLSNPREPCPVPTCGCQLAGTRWGGQHLSSHPQWNPVPVGAGRVRELRFQAVYHPCTLADPLRLHTPGCWLGTQRTSEALFSGSIRWGQG